MHKHKVQSEGRDRAYYGYVPDAGPAAGNIEREQTCACGATRMVAINGKHFAATPWATKQEEVSP